MIRAVNTGVSAHIDAGGRVRTQTISVDPDDVPPTPPQTILVELAMLPGGGLYRHVGDLFGFVSVAALIYFLARRGSGKRSAPAAVR